MTRTDRTILGGFVAISLLARLACIHLNSAEYTDGILQITAFDYGFTFWPPAFTVIVKALGLVIRDPELAGKIISIVSSTLLLIPVFLFTLRVAGRRAAVYALLFCMTDAIAVRWSIRVMSDSLFALLFFWATVLFLTVLEWGQTEPTIAGERKMLHIPWAAFCFGGLLAPLATLTRYQGILLLPLQMIALQMFWGRRRNSQNPRSVGVAFATVLPWLAVAAWIYAYRGGHEQQIAERAGESLADSLLIYWNLLESFVLLFPYFITVPAFALVVAGLAIFLAGERQRRAFALVFFAFAVFILAMQSVFGSYQERYLLPLIPFMAVLAGVAAARWEERAGRRLAAVRTALVLTFAYGLAWSVAVLALQRGAFGNIKEAARYCATLPPQARIFSNEHYKAEMLAIKMSFWSGRRVEGFTGLEALAKGDYLCLHSSYGGLSRYPALVPYMRFDEQIAQIKKRYDCLEEAWFEARLVPLLPDIMENPDTHQNPVAWFYRYYPQRFRTVVLRIEGPRSAR
jgi:hypothetical protein